MLKKIRAYDLQAGMYVVDTGLSWMDHPYLYSQEGLVESDEQVLAIRTEGFAEAFIETGKSAFSCDSQRIYDSATVDKAIDKALSEDIAMARSNKNVPLHEEMAAALLVHSRSMDVVRGVMAALARNTPMDGQAATDAARDIAGSVARNRDALLSLAMLQDADEYTFRHSVSVSALAAAFGDYLGLARPQVGELALAGLLHDIGKALSPKDLLAKPEALSAEEQARLKHHPIESCAAVSAHMTVPRQVLRAIAEHHERYDGSGYPRGIKAAEQSYYGQILAIADVYAALTQERPYKARLLPDKAMSVMFAMRGKDFEPKLLEHFVKCVGLYVVGSLVRLSTGEHAVVRESNPESPLRPKVSILFDAEMRPIHPVFLDLSGKEGPAPARPVDVLELLDHRHHGFEAREHLL